MYESVSFKFVRTDLVIEPFEETIAFCAAAGIVTENAVFPTPPTTEMTGTTDEFAGIRGTGLGEGGG